MENITNCAFINNFASLFNNSNNNECEFIANKRESTFKKFAESGLPSVKTENWKYANLSFLNNYRFKLASDEDNIIDNNYIIDNSLIDLKQPNTIAFINGEYSNELSNYNNDELDINPLAEMFKNAHSELLSKYFGNSDEFCSDVFHSLNTAFSTDGSFIRIKKGKVINNQIQIVNIFSADTNQLAVFPRNLIIAEDSSYSNIIEYSIKVGNQISFSSSVTEIYLNSNSKIDYERIQILPTNHFHIGNSFISQQRDSVFNDTTIYLDGKFVRNNIYTKHLSENADTNYFGFYLSDEDDFIDNHTFIDHSKANCQSNEVYKGIISGRSVAVFNGKILVRPDAQKINAYQTNNNILLSDLATINTKPELEIYADDVKCSHGATTGRLDEEHLFYLRARGIDLENAHSLLLSAFGEEIIEKIKSEVLRNKVSGIFEKKLMEMRVEIR